MAQSVVDQIVSALNQRAMFVEAQAGAGISREALLESQTQSLVATIKSTQGITIDNAPQITDTVTRGPWSEAQKITLATAVSDAMSSAGSGNARCQQHCKTAELFLTQKDWDSCILNADMAVMAKLSYLSQRMYKLGMTCGSEKLRGRIVSVVLAFGLPEDHGD
eukprot:5168868-Pyramimonas_sp.AAC.1